MMMDRWMDGRSETSIPHLNFVSRGYNDSASIMCVVQSVLFVSMYVEQVN